MKVLVLISLVLILFASGCWRSESNGKYVCYTKSDCVSTCGWGCVNTNWVEGYEEPCANVRAFDCSCVEGVCYTDGQAPIG